MTNYFKLIGQSLVLLASLTIQFYAYAASERSWLERPWQMRYIVTISDADAWERSKLSAFKRNRNSNDKSSLKYFDTDEFFNAYPVPLKFESSDYGSKKIGVILVEFDKNGFVTTPNTHPKGLRARIATTLSVLFSSQDPNDKKLSVIGNWFTGIGDGEGFAPGLCTLDELPGASSGNRYTKDFKPYSTHGAFGCREWAYQLYDNQRPYIDVTSYEPKSEDYPDGTYIRTFLGWARFGDKKPVIGKHIKTWVCLLDCPKGDKPGIIPDIKKWAKKNGWSIPKPPEKQPQFPDADFMQERDSDE